MANSFARCCYSRQPPPLESLPIVIRSLGRHSGDYDSSFWNTHAFHIARELGMKTIYLFVDATEVPHYTKLHAHGCEVHVVKRLGRDLSEVESFINNYLLDNVFNEAAFVLQLNDDVKEVVDSKGAPVPWGDVAIVLKEMLARMSKYSIGLGGFYSTGAYMSQRVGTNDVWEYGNVFVLEHLCLRVVQKRFRLSENWSKIDFERSILTYLHFGSCVRVRSLHVRTAKNVEGGCGTFATRPEERHASALVRMYPDFVAEAYALQSGQWSLRLKSLLPWKTPISEGAGSDAVDYRKNTTVGKRSRTVSLNDLEDSYLDDSLASESGGGTAGQLLETLRNALQRHQMILDDSTSAVALGRRLAKMKWSYEHCADGNVWKKKAVSKRPARKS